MFRDLFSGHDLAGSTLLLIGRNVDRPARTERLARLLNEKSGAGLRIERTADWWSVFHGAEFVINSTGIDRKQLWKFDFEVARNFRILTRITLTRIDEPRCRRHAFFNARRSG
jgi:alpha-galactosidase